ncbi:hypothetical protein [Streptococcus hyointestinalis]|uniref:hypothetical protein n=1 Tax=Streptococcus hyointestinalis TaxID=1337 RepID=UPI003D008B47
MRNFISVLLADMDRHILVDVKTSKQKRQTFWRSFLTYLVVFLLSIATILLTFYLLFQGLLNQQIIYYIGALLVFLLAFFMSYQLIFLKTAFLWLVMSSSAKSKRTVNVKQKNKNIKKITDKFISDFLYVLQTTWTFPFWEIAEKKKWIRRQRQSNTGTIL